MTDKFFKELDAAAKRHSANRTYGGDIDIAINMAIEESFRGWCVLAERTNGCKQVKALQQHYRRAV